MRVLVVIISLYFAFVSYGQETKEGLSASQKSSNHSESASSKVKLKFIPQIGHSAFITSAVYSNDSKLIATGSPKMVKVFDLLTKKELLSLPGADNPIFSPDGTSLFYSDVFSLVGIKLENDSVFFKKQFSSDSFSLSDSLPRICGLIENEMWNSFPIVIDYLSGEIIYEGSDISYSSCFLNASGLRMLSTINDSIVVIDIETKNQMIKFPKSNNEVFGFLDNDHILLNDLGTIKIINVESKYEVSREINISNIVWNRSTQSLFMKTAFSFKEYNLQLNEINDFCSDYGKVDCPLPTFTDAIDVSPDGTKIICSPEPGVIEEWSLKSKKLTRKIKGSVSRNTGVQFLLKNNSLAITSVGKSPILVNLKNGQLEKKKGFFAANYYNSEFTQNSLGSLDGENFIYLSEDENIFDPEEKLFFSSGQFGLLSSGLAAKMNKPWANCIENKRIDIYDQNNLKLNSYAGSLPMCLSQNGYLAYRFRNSIVVKNIRTNKKITSITPSYGKIDNSIAIDNQGKYLGFTTDNNTADIISLDSKKRILMLSLQSVDQVYFTNEGLFLTGGYYDNTLNVYDPNKEVRIASRSSHNNRISDFSENEKHLFTTSKDGTTKVWDKENWDLIATIILYDTLDVIIITPDNYYLSTKNGINGIGFKNGKRILPCEQFDVLINRPDIVLERLGYASPEKIKSYNHAYQKRLQKMNFTEEMLKADFHLPEASITNEADLSVQLDIDQLTLNIETTDSKYLLDRINVWINNVPIYGVNGISLRSKMIQDFDTTIQLQLSEGDNKIEVSVLNQAGAESYKETVYMNCTKPAPKPNLYFVGIGVKNYENEDMNLKYSDKDIRDVANLYGSNKSYGKVYIDTFLNASVTKNIIPQIRKRLEATTIHDQVIFMYSGHGVLDDSLDYYLTTHNIDFLNPKANGIPYEAVDDLLDNIPARKKLVLIDACNSGEVDKDEMEETNSGVTAEVVGGKGDMFKKYATKTNSFEMMQELFTDLRRGTGATVISSSSGKYFSFEDKKYQNGVYTYALKLGLEGAADANSNGEITVSELKEYLYTKVESLTNGKQKPTARQENLEYDYRVW